MAVASRADARDEPDRRRWSFDYRWFLWLVTGIWLAVACLGLPDEVAWWD
jgi:hypothetical protein